MDPVLAGSVLEVGLTILSLRSGIKEIDYLSRLFFDARTPTAVVKMCCRCGEK